MEVKKSLKKSYSEQYRNIDEEWRIVGGEKKAKNIISIAPNNKSYTNVLDVGSGDGAVLYWLDKLEFNDNITSVEISESGIERIKERQLSAIKELLLFDGYRLSFEDDFFDVALCSHVMEHVEFPRKLIREIARVSKEQIFEVPIDFSYQIDKKAKHYLDYGHINIYTPQTFRFFLISEGLDIIDYQNNLYDNKMFDLIYKKQGIVERVKNRIKRVLWPILPPLMEKRPNTTTVRTKKSAQPLSIM